MSKQFLDVCATVRDDSSISIYRVEAGNHLVLHDTYRDTQKAHDELQAWSVATIKRDNEIAQLSATVTAQAERIAALEQAVGDARKIVEAVGSSYDDDRVCEIRVERDKDSAWWVSSACIAWLAAHPAPAKAEHDAALLDEWHARL